MKLLLLSIVLPLLPILAIAEEVYLAPETFVAQSFDGSPPEPTRYLANSNLQKTVNRIMKRKYRIRPVNYWREGNKTVWILEEIGKYKPITTGIVVNDGVIDSVQILIYRESHGWEVRYPNFTDQFKQATLTEKNKLDRSIDGISGATLSVKSITRLSQLALFYHQQVMQDG